MSLLAGGHAVYALEAAEHIWIDTSQAQGKLVAQPCCRDPSPRVLKSCLLTSSKVLEATAGVPWLASHWLHVPDVVTLHCCFHSVVAAFSPDVIELHRVVVVPVVVTI